MQNERSLKMQNEPSFIAQGPNGVVFSSMYSDSDSSDSTPNLIPNHHLYHSRSVQEHQEIINRHSLCRTHLRDAARETEAFRRLELTHLHAVQRELYKHFMELSHLNMHLNKHASVQNQLGSSSSGYTARFGVLDAFRGLCIGDEGSEGSAAWDDVTTVTTKAGASDGARTRIATRPRTVSPPKVTEKVYVRGGKKEEEQLELEVYNRGMFKTELCIKWKETGACPYGDQCLFAHGIKELRPVLKTEVCALVVYGVVCPSGHRCLFRHTLTDQERLI